jgi:rubrerythrin
MDSVEHHKGSTSFRMNTYDEGLGLNRADESIDRSNYLDFSKVAGEGKSAYMTYRSNGELGEHMMEKRWMEVIQKKVVEKRTEEEVK